jgi:tetratricopeptide (TPR) repeat protein
MNTIEESQSAIQRRPWNPVAVLIVSLFCTPLPGGILHALNYARLGQAARVKSTLITNLLLAMIIVLVSYRSSMMARRDLQMQLLGLFLTIVASIYFYRSQVQLFRARMAQGVKSGGWVTPALLGVVCVGVLLGVSFSLEYVRLNEFNRGISLMNTQQYAEAEQIFERYKKSDPGMAEAYYNLAIIYMNSGREQLAAQELRNFLRISPFDGEARSLLRSLESGGEQARGNERDPAKN